MNYFILLFLPLSWGLAEDHLPTQIELKQAQTQKRKARSEVLKKKRQERARNQKVLDDQEDLRILKIRGNKLENLIPEGWHEKRPGKNENGYAKGDLDKDGIEDLAIVIESSKSDHSDVIPHDGGRLALLLFKGQPDGTYQCIRIARDAIYSRSDGGQYDPFSKISITHGVISLEYFGSYGLIGFERWKESQKIRFQSGDFYLIGRTRNEFLAVPPGQDANETSTDINYSTGKTITSQNKKRASESVNPELKPIKVGPELTRFPVAGSKQ